MKYLLLLTLAACASAPSARPALYGVELEECNRTAKTCDESIACENRVRMKYARPMRTGGCE